MPGVRVAPPAFYLGTHPALTGGVIGRPDNAHLGVARRLQPAQAALATGGDPRGPLPGGRGAETGQPLGGDGDAGNEPPLDANCGERRSAVIVVRDRAAQGQRQRAGGKRVAGEGDAAAALPAAENGRHDAARRAAAGADDAVRVAGPAPGEGLTRTAPGRAARIIERQCGVEQADRTAAVARGEAGIGAGRQIERLVRRRCHCRCRRRRR